MTSTELMGNRLKAYLLSHDSQCGVPASDAEILEFEMRNMTTIPEDMRAYFREVNGTAGDYAYGIIRFWNIEEVRTLAQELMAKRTSMALIHSRYTTPIQDEGTLFVFADYMHESQLYAIQLSPGAQRNPVIMLDGSDPTEIAISFTDFVERYLTTPEELRLMID